MVLVDGDGSLRDSLPDPVAGSPSSKAKARESNWRHIPSNPGLSWHDRQQSRPTSLELLRPPAGRWALLRDYLEQLTYLLFLKMADEQTRPPSTIHSARRARLAVAARSEGEELEAHYQHILEELGKGEACSGSSSARRRTVSRIRPSCGG